MRGTYPPSFLVCKEYQQVEQWYGSSAELVDVPVVGFIEWMIVGLCVLWWGVLGSMAHTLITGGCPSVFIQVSSVAVFSVFLLLAQQMQVVWHGFLKNSKHQAYLRENTSRALKQVEIYEDLRGIYLGKELTQSICSSGGEPGGLRYLWETHGDLYDLLVHLCEQCHKEDF